MKPFFIVALLVAVLLGSGVTYAVMKQKETTTTNTAQSDSMSGMNHDMSDAAMSDMSMSAMNAELKGLTGDAFDKAFIGMMIEHHQGAIDMAKQAQANAKHEEVKAMANDIVTAQEREIAQMKEWQKQWGY